MIHSTAVRKRLRLILLALIVVFSAGSFDCTVASARISYSSGADKLAYSLNNFGGTPSSLMLYDPQTGKSQSVHTNINFIGFSFDRSGHLRFWSEGSKSRQVYSLDALAANGSLEKINLNTPPNTDMLMWSPDGRYLILTDNKNKHLYVWNGSTLVDITPDDLSGLDSSYPPYWFVWSRDGRLAFTVSYDVGYPPKSDVSEVYVWDGKTTTNLSQNPTGEDREPSWSADGRLAFLSSRSGEYDIYIWDGITTKNGIPDVSTYINIAPELITYYSYPIWTDKDLLSFKAVASTDEHAQVYLWDGQNATNISKNPTMHNGSQAWSGDGRWAFATYFSPQPLVYVRSIDNQTLLTAEGQYLAWSSNGYLIFCTYTGPEWVLSIWDGNHISEIARGDEIAAQWQSGSSMVCSNG